MAAVPKGAPMIDLHMHTTASDGVLTPAALMDRAFAVGIRTLSVTDHDTMAGIADAAAAAASHGMEFLPGIEITAVDNQRDVHMLAYFLDPDPPGLASFLVDQRSDRSRRAREMSEKLAGLGVPIDIDDLISVAEADGKAVGRPSVAQALVDAGHVVSVQEAFGRWLADDGAAYVPRVGISPTDVVRLVARNGGVSALAHPKLLRKDDLVPSLAKAGLGAIEVYHSQHATSDESHYLRLAEQYQLAVCGGSDFHGDQYHRAKRFGKVGVPRERFVLLLQRLLQAHSMVHGEAPSV